MNFRRCEKQIFKIFDHVQNQAGFDNPFITGKGFIYLGISKMSFTFEVYTRVQGSVSIKAARKANI